MRKVNGREMIVIVFVCLVVGATPVAARSLPSQSESSIGHGPLNWRCHYRPGDLARHSARQSRAFETEYDVENWEKALRQESAPPIAGTPGGRSRRPPRTRSNVGQKKEPP